jgi:hypothetical protein
MLKKIALTTLFALSFAVGASGAVFAKSATKAPTPAIPHGFSCWPVGMCL